MSTSEVFSAPPSISSACPVIVPANLLALRSAKIRDHHLLRKAVVYIRQSSPQQVAEHKESTVRNMRWPMWPSRSAGPATASRSSTRTKCALDRRLRVVQVFSTSSRNLVLIMSAFFLDRMPVAWLATTRTGSLWCARAACSGLLGDYTDKSHLGVHEASDIPIFALLPHFTPLAWPAADDRVRPLERFGEHPIEVNDEVQQFITQILHRCERTTPDHLPHDHPEDRFDLVQPRTVLGRIHEPNPVALLRQERLPARHRFQHPTHSLLPQRLLDPARLGHLPHQRLRAMDVQIIHSLASG